MRYVPKAERCAWHETAMEAAGDGQLSSLIDLWLAAKEIGRLVERLRNASNRELEGISHYTTEPVAKHLPEAHPDVAAKVYRALAMRIVNASKSRYYPAALASFQEAKRCYQKAGLLREWEAMVAEVRGAHCRKYGFLPGFERIATFWASIPWPLKNGRTAGLPTPGVGTNAPSDELARQNLRICKEISRRRR